MAHIDREYARQERLIQQAKAAYANRNIPSGNRGGEPACMLFYHRHLSFVVFNRKTFSIYVRGIWLTYHYR